MGIYLVWVFRILIIAGIVRIFIRYIREKKRRDEGRILAPAIYLLIFILFLTFFNPIDKPVIALIGFVIFLIIFLPKRKKMVIQNRKDSIQFLKEQDKRWEEQRKKSRQIKKKLDAKKKKLDAILSIEKKVKCDDGITRIYNGFMYGIIKEKAVTQNGSWPYEVISVVSKASTSVINADYIYSVDKSWSDGIFNKSISNEKWFSESGITLNIDEIISKAAYFHKKYWDYKKTYVSRSFTTFEAGRKPEYNIVRVNGYMFYQLSSAGGPNDILFSGIIDGIVLTNGLIEENKIIIQDTIEKIEKATLKEKYTVATGKSEKEFEKFWETRKSIEKTISNVKENNEQYAFPKEALTIIDELTYIGEEKKIFNGYEIIETFDDGKPKKIVKYKDGKRTNEYKEHPFDLNPPKS